MGFTLKQIKDALSNLCVLNGQKEYALDEIDEAIDALNNVLQTLDGLTVCGRGTIDSLLGCMLAIEQIIGGDSNGG